jgi:hypothetical protein
MVRARVRTYHGMDPYHVVRTCVPKVPLVLWCGHAMVHLVHTLVRTCMRTITGTI